MKTYIKGIFTLIISLLVVTSVNVYAATIGTSQSKDEVNIRNTIHTYFTNELDTIKTKRSIHSDNIIVNESLKEYSNLTNDYYASWYSKSEVSLGNLINYKIYIDYPNIEIKENTCAITLTKGTDMIFDIDPNIIQKARNDEYTFTLNKVNNKWLIEGIVSPDDTTDTQQINKLNINLNNTANKLNDLKTSYSNIDTIVSKFNKITANETKVEPAPLVTASYSGVTYNRLAAYQYALDNWDTYNLAYPKWSNDCTNFVSQCVSAGGFKEVRPAWYASSVSDTSTSWINVNDFYKWLTSTPGHIGYGTAASNMVISDVIQLYNNSWNVKDWSHCVIQTSNPSTQIYYAGHTTARWSYALANVYPTTKYTDARFIKIQNMP